MEASAPLRHVHADFHMGNVVVSNRGLMAIDVDSVCLSIPDKAFAALIGKVYEQDSPESLRALVAAVIGVASEQGMNLEPGLLRLHVLQKKLGEIRYLDRVRESRVGISPAGKHYRADAIKGSLAPLT